MRDTIPEIGAFVALGDSFTEGLGDPHPDGTGYRGWADRFAERLAASRPGLRYANLAVRGKVVADVAADQIPVLWMPQPVYQISEISKNLHGTMPQSPIESLTPEDWYLTK